MEELEFSEEVFRFIMPQKEPMLLCDGLIANDVFLDRQRCVYTVGKRDSIALTKEGHLPAICLMEVMAQTVAATFAGRKYLRDDGASLNVGLYLSIRGFKMLKHYAQGLILKGTKLTTEVSFSEGIEGVVLADACVYQQQDIVAKAKITVLSPTDEELKRALGEEIANRFLDSSD